jgi:hypothetical protein
MEEILRKINILEAIGTCCQLLARDFHVDPSHPWQVLHFFAVLKFETEEVSCRAAVPTHQLFETMKNFWIE